MAGPPLTRHSAVSLLSAYNVTVGLGVGEQWDARNLHFDVGWVRLTRVILPGLVSSSLKVNLLLSGFLEVNGTLTRREA